MGQREYERQNYQNTHGLISSTFLTYSCSFGQVKMPSHGHRSGSFNQSIICAEAIDAEHDGFTKSPGQAATILCRGLVDAMLRVAGVRA
jgi:hypothetical protein